MANKRIYTGLAFVSSCYHGVQAVVFQAVFATKMCRSSPVFSNLLGNSHNLIESACVCIGRNRYYSQYDRISRGINKLSEINSIIERMKQVTDCRTDTQLAEYLELRSNSAISTWKARDRVPYAECHKIANEVNVDLGWLITGKQSGESIFPNPIVGHVVKPAAEAGLVQIPQYEADLSAGVGAYPADHELAIGSRPFSAEWLKKKGLKPTNLKLLRVLGDSMEPLLKDKDMVMIDTSRTTPTEAMPFAIRLDGELFVKSIQRQGGGNLLLVSKNSSYRDIIIDSNHPPDSFAVIGAVVWHAHSWI